MAKGNWKTNADLHKYILKVLRDAINKSAASRDEPDRLTTNQVFKRVVTDYKFSTTGKTVLERLHSLKEVGHVMLYETKKNRVTREWKITETGLAFLRGRNGTD